MSKMRITECLVCGKKIYNSPRGCLSHLCPTCKHKHRKELERINLDERYRRERIALNNKIAAEHLTATAKIITAARAAGLSYGAYVARGLAK